MDRRSHSLILALLITATLVCSFSFPAGAQNSSPAASNLSARVISTWVTVDEDQKIQPHTETGSGFVIGTDKSNVGDGSTVGTIFVVTDYHVVSLGAKIVVHFKRDDKDTELVCRRLLAPEHMDPASPDADPDIAVLACPQAPIPLHFAYDVLGTRGDLRAGVRTFSNGFLAGESEPVSGYFSFRKWQCPKVYTIAGTEVKAVDYVDCVPEKIPSAPSPAPARRASPKSRVFRLQDQFSRALDGVSGGQVLTDRSELVGIGLEGGSHTLFAYDWAAIQVWIDKNPKNQIPNEPKKRLIPMLLRRHARSAPTLRSGNVEFSLELTSLYVPRFGWMTQSPRLRIATALPNLNLVDLAFDFTFSQSTRYIGSGIENLSVTVPAVTGEFALGALPKIRHYQWLGGTYVGSGVAPLFLQDTKHFSTLQSSSIRSWTPVFDAGWRYRMPGREWGFSASYREGILVGNETQGLYSRFRSFSGGMFILFR